MASRPPHRARFLEKLPDHDALRALGESFEAGNYARVRAEAPRLASDPEASEDVRKAAQDLLQRIQPDPLVVFFLGLSLALLIGATLFAYSVSHG